MLTVSFELFEKVAVIKTTSNERNQLRLEMRVAGQFVPEATPQAR